MGRIFHNDQVLAHLHQSLFVFFLHLQISACESSWKRKMKNCAKSIISCLKSLFIKWTLMHTKDTNILLSFELSYSGMGKQILKKIAQSSTVSGNRYFHQNNIHVYRRQIWALYTLSLYLHHFPCLRVFLCSKIIKDYNEGFTLHPINNHWHWKQGNDILDFELINCWWRKNKEGKVGYFATPPPPISFSIKSFKTQILKWQMV